MGHEEMDFPSQPVEEETPPSSSQFCQATHPLLAQSRLLSIRSSRIPRGRRLDNEMLCAGFYVTQPGDCLGPR